MSEVGKVAVSEGNLVSVSKLAENVFKDSYIFIIRN